MSRAGCYSKGREREREWVLQQATYVIKRLRNKIEWTPNRTPPTISMVSIATASAFGVDVSDIKGGSLWCIDVGARQIAMAVAYLVVPRSLQELAEYFNRSDHTVILHAYRKYGADLTFMCKQNNVPIHPRSHRNISLSRGPYRRFTQRMKLAKNLQALVKWRGEPKFSDEIFPDLDPHQRTSLMGWLRRHGYAAIDGVCHETRLWKITDEGLKAYAELRHLLRHETEMKEAA